MTPGAQPPAWVAAGTVQLRDPAIESDLAWSDAPAGVAHVVREAMAP